MSLPEGCHHYRERIGTFMLGKLEGGEHASSSLPGVQPATTSYGWEVEEPKTVP